MDNWKHYEFDIMNTSGLHKKKISSRKEKKI